MRVLASVFVLWFGMLETAGAARTPAAVKVAIVTDRGQIVVVLDPARAPITVRNFLGYVDRKFYDGGTFFRAIPDFVIQGGNKPRETSSDPTIPLESPLKTGIRNTDGAISMARKPIPDSATSEFFICDGAQPRLDGSIGGDPGYAAFGHVVEGIEVVRAIAHSPATEQMLDQPVKIIRIARVR